MLSQALAAVLGDSFIRSSRVFVFEALVKVPCFNFLFLFMLTGLADVS